ncbi:MAG: Fic family protein [Coriobacteriia bacterium]|nr:Fic family protein [Coriobacteriia bacterium]
MSEELDVLIRQADKKKAELGVKAAPSPEAEDAFEERFLIASIYNSLAIEGNGLSEAEIERVLTNDEVIAGKTLTDHLSVIAYRNATMLARQYARSKVRISEHEIRKLHTQLIPDQQLHGGEYRSYNLMIRGHRPTSYEKIGYKMLQLVEHYGSSEDEHPIEAIAFFHLRIEKIHPFADGNGRVGRLIINLMLEAAGYPPVIFPVEEKSRYYAALEAYDGLQGNPDIKPMQTYLAELVNRQLDELLAL